MPETTATWICRGCARGRHPHDRFSLTGEDAGCPQAMWSNGRLVAQCACQVTLPRAAPRTCPTCGQQVHHA